MKSNQGEFSVKAAADRIGISPVTLRSWERRHELVEPMRTGGQRRYTLEQVLYLKAVQDLIEAGHRVGELAGLSHSALASLAANLDQSAQQDQRVTRLLRAVDSYDLAAIDNELTELLSFGVSEHQVVARIHDLMHRIGELWNDGKLSIAQERLLSQALQLRLIALLTAWTTSRAITFVCASPEQEIHQIGLLLFAVRAQRAGFGVRFLGGNLPLAEINRVCVALNAPVAALSLTDHTLYDDEPAFGATCDKVLPFPQQIWLGGRAASEQMVSNSTRLRCLSNPEDLEGALLTLTPPR